MIELRPCTLEQANSFVYAHHRHSGPKHIARFAIAAMQAGELVGVVIVGNPVARGLQDGVTAEALRVCVVDGAQKGTPSRLLRAAWRAWAAMGGARMITYTLEHEGGASLRGAGFRLVGTVPGRSWSCPSRLRKPRPIEKHAKQRYEVRA